MNLGFRLGVFHFLTVIFLIFFAGRGNAEMKTNIAVPAGQVAQQYTDTVKINALIQKSLAGTSPNKIFLEQAKHLATKANLMRYFSEHLYRAAIKERLQEDFQTALLLNFEGLKLTEKKEDTDLMTKFYNNIGVSFRKLEDHSRSLKYSLKALQLSERAHDTINMSIAINSMGNSYLMIGKYNTALEYFKRSLVLEKNTKNMIGVAINLNNIGKVYLRKKDYKKALNYFNLSLEINKQIHSLKGEIVCYGDLTDTYIELNQFRKAETYAMKALQLAHQTSDTVKLAHTYLKLGILNSKNHQYSRSVQNLKKGITYSLKKAEKRILMQAYRTMAEVYKNEKNFKKALFYNTLAYQYHDSLTSVEIKKNTARLQVQFETQQKENQIILLNQKNRLAQLSMKKQRYLIYFLLSMSLLLFLLMTFLIWVTYINRKRNRQLIAKNKEIERVKNQLEKNRQELLEANEQAERNALAKNRFLAHISHEIRTPLNSILGFTELLGESIKSPLHKSYIQAINTSGKSLLNLLNNILDFAKYENRDLSFRWEEINLREVLTEVKNIFSLKAAEKELKLDIHFKNIYSEVVFFNQMILQQIMLNLVGNAIKYTHKGSIEILLSEKKSKEKDKIDLTLEVTDTGTGIPEKELSHIFEPFYQGESIDEQEGAGLGLSITHTLVMKMGGTIEVKSRQNEGTHFTIRFKGIKIEPPETDNDNNLYDDNEVRTSLLFINNSKEYKADIIELFDKYNYDLLNVGLRLPEAKKHMGITPLIILCCLDQEELKNTLNIIENENQSEQQQILVITKNDTDINVKSNATVLINNEREVFLSQLEDFIIRFKDGNPVYNLFSTTYEDKNQIKLALSQLFHNEFMNAYSSRMFDNIKFLSDQLATMANQYQMPNLHTFAEEMKTNIEHFNITALDKQLNLLAKIFRSTYHFK